MKRGLLTDWERKVLKSKNVKRQYKYRLEHRISDVLDQTSHDIKDLLFSDKLTSFNLQNKAKWMAVYQMLQMGLSDLEQRIPSFRYDEIASVIKDGQECFYAHKSDTLTYQDPQLSRGIFTATGFMDEGNGDVEILKKLIDNPQKLRIWLSTRRIKKRYAQTIIKKAVILGFPFPKNSKEAVHLWQIKNWIHNKEMEKISDKAQKSS